MINQHIITVSLGVISVLIAIRYMNLTDKLFNEVRYIRSKCVVINNKNEIKKLITKIKDKHNLSLKQLKSLLIKKKKSIKENYQNYNLNKSLDFIRNNKIVIGTSCTVRAALAHHAKKNLAKNKIFLILCCCFTTITEEQSKKNEIAFNNASIFLH